ncbi:MAG: nuclear transport factor 2 family protein [Sphingobacteriia bacterium]|jgi:ketosteroid isomerase-like protein
MNAIQQINEHYQVIIDKNLEGICSKYIVSEDTYVVLEGPRLTTIGYEKIKKGWTDFCASSLQLISIEWIEGPFAEERTDMAWVAGIIKLSINVNERAFENIFRSTFVLIKDEGIWKIKHEHVSVVHPDPYGIGDWLKK